MSGSLDEIRAHAAELEAAIDAAPDEATAGAAADELHALYDSVENVHALDWRR